MPRAVRAYTYELCDSFVPCDVISAMGEPRHIRQLRLLVFARSGQDALNLLVNLGLQQFYGSRKPMQAYGNDMVALEHAGLNHEGSVYVLGDQTSNVGRVHFDDSYIGARTTTVVGTLRRHGLGVPLEFVPVKETEDEQQSSDGADHVFP